MSMAHNYINNVFRWCFLVKMGVGHCLKVSNFDYDIAIVFNSQVFYLKISLIEIVTTCRYIVYVLSMSMTRCSVNKIISYSFLSSKFELSRLRYYIILSTKISKFRILTYWIRKKKVWIFYTTIIYGIVQLIVY